MKSIFNIVIFLLLFNLCQAQSNALQFDGVDDYISVPASPNLDLSSGTVECWVKPSSFSGGSCILGVRGTGGTRYSFHIRADNIGLWNGSSIFPVSYSFSIGQWYHLAFVSDRINNTLKYYINGVLIGSSNNSFGNLSGQPLVIGAVKSGATPTELFNGAIDEVRIWSSIRTQEDIQTYKDVSLTGSETNLVALYNFNQGTAGGSNSSEITVPDKTQNTNNGTLYNFALTGSASNFVSNFLSDVTYQGTYWQINGNAGTNPTSNALGTTDNQRLAFKTKNIERMTLLPNGNLGIGTSQPNHTFSVVGGDGFVVARPGEKNYILFEPSINNRDWNFGIWNNGWSADLFMDARNLIVGSRGSNAKLLIGDKVNPDSIGDNLLAVKGSAVFNKVKVKLYNASTGWADYVFKKNYNLLSLKQVEAYINKNHHLPGVPAAEEVKKNDLDVGENQAVLLKKIEELTLYLIDQNKKIEAQQKEINRLKTKK